MRASLTVATGVISFDEATHVVDYRTVILLFTMMIVTSYLNLSGFFNLVGENLLDKLHTRKQLLFVVIFIGMFVIIGGVEHSGLLNELLTFPVINRGMSIPAFMTLTVALSNVVSNVPAVMLLKYLIPGVHSELWWANMAVFSTLAGNLT